MDSDGSEEFGDVFEPGDEKHVDKLVDKVLKLNKNQQLKKPSRTEPALKVSEFDLVKSVADKASIQLNELTKSLKHKRKTVKIHEKIKKVGKSQTLPKPLEKPQAERIRRTVGYENSRLALDRWESVVESNRVATQLTFPLNKDVITKKDDDGNTWRIKSDLQKELEKIEPKVETYDISLEEKKFPMSLKEMLARRREAAKLRAYQGYREAKARRQNKIKSKKYHRIQRREKVKEKLKEFELLQKTNPEEALRRLEEIEKARIQERFSLRHKSTGQWAKNKQIRAKYDKESRKVLAQQLTISKELTQKMQTQNDSDSDEEKEEDPAIIKAAMDDPDNPWVNGIKPNKEVIDFVSGYRKFWNEKNKALAGEENEEEKLSANGENDEEEPPTNEENGEEGLLTNVEKKEKESLISEENQEEELSTNEDNQEKEPLTNGESKKPLTNGLNKEAIKEKPAAAKKVKSPKKQKLKKTEKKPTKKQKVEKSEATSDWEVSTLDIDNIFDDLEQQIQKKALKNAKELKKQMNKKKQPLKEKNQKSTKTKKPDLSMPMQKKRPIIDEELIETTGREANEESKQTEELKSILSIPKSKKPDLKDKVDPNNFIKVQTTHLDTAIPNLLINEDDDANEDIENEQKNLIMEAFEDADLVQDFRKEKKDEIDKNKPKDINLALPGWGCWGGNGIRVNKRKNRRFTIKAPPKVPRRDDNKGSLIINEQAQQKVREHMVSDLPFPFKSVKDFEASIRAPVGNTFVPETAFKRLTQPAVVTKMGAIIEPMDKTALLNKKKK